MQLLNVVAQKFLGLISACKRGGVIINEHTLSREQTRFHVQLLQRHFDLIALDELPGRLAHAGKRPFCLLTFDDGKRSHATEVAPELERMGVPAVFYLTTDAVSNRSALWFDRQQALERALGCRPPGLELRTLKQLPFAELSERLDRACAKHSINPDLNVDHICPMSWKDARALQERGFVIGAHGRTHAILTNETWKTACLEIEESMAAATAELGSRCRTFAFPNGNYTRALAQHAVACGASTVMTTDPEWVQGGCEFWRLPRIQLFGNFSEARIAVKIAAGAMRGLLPNPNGTGRPFHTYARPGFSASQRRALAE